jgi:putative heme-binding domain-containing protein
MYRAILCANCHVRNGRGGEIGPDLTNLHTRFSKKDILDAIINPSKVISEQFTNMEVQMNDGNTLVGQLLHKDEKVIRIGGNPFDLSVYQEYPTKSVPLGLNVQPCLF